MRPPAHVEVSVEELAEPHDSSSLDDELELEDGMTRLFVRGSPRDDSDSEQEEHCVAHVAKVEAVELYEASSEAKSSEATVADDPLQIDEADDPLQIDEDDCPLCLDTVTDGFRTPCGHVFCAPCLAKALLRNDSCPVCRKHGMHTCARPTDGCRLCVAGHKPGVVVPNAFGPVSDDSGRRSPFAYMSFGELALLSCKISCMYIVLALAGFLCVKRMIPVVAFCGVCFLTTLTNVALVSGTASASVSEPRWACALWCVQTLQQWLQQIHEQIMRRDPGVRGDDRQEHDADVEAAVRR